MTPSRCTDRQEAITALVLGVADSNQAAEILEHLGTCGECMALYEELSREEALVQTAFGKIRAGTESQGTNLQPACISGNGSVATAPSKSYRFNQWARRWKYAPTLALAAVLLLAVTGLFFWLDLANVTQGTAFGAVIQNMARARTVTYTKTVQFEGGPAVVHQEMATDRGLFRSATSRKASVLDFANNRQIVIYPLLKTASVTYKPFHISENHTLISYLGWLGPIYEAEGTWVGQTDLNGTKTNVFTISKPFHKITIWTGIKTTLPVRVEMVETPCLDKDIRLPEMTLFLDEFGDAEDPGEERSMGAGDDSRMRIITLYGPGVCQETKTTTLTDFTWNGSVDESLLQVTAPEGYQVIQADDGDPPRGEDALIAALRFWAETSERTFPGDINMLLDSKPLLIQRFASSVAPEQGYAEAIKMGYVVVAGSLFAQQLKTVDNWHYAGRDVKLGEADKPLCWWKTRDPATYRVIYGDLSIRDVPAADLPMAGKP